MEDAKQMEVEKSFEQNMVTVNKSSSVEGQSIVKLKPFKIEARDIMLKPFVPQIQPTSMPLYQDYLDAYLSTPSFIKHLTDISDDVMTYQTPKEKKLFLKQKLCDVNQMLPAQVYIPFVSKSMRNFAILNIAVEEAKIFQTKERAPLLLCIEAYRPIEMTLDDTSEIFDAPQMEKLAGEEG